VARGISSRSKTPFHYTPEVPFWKTWMARDPQRNQLIKVHLEKQPLNRSSNNILVVNGL